MTLSPRGLVTLLFVAVVGLGCASAPIQEMSDARRALTMAREVGGNASVAPGYERAVRRVENARRALASGDFNTARDHALEGKTLAVSVRALSMKLTGLEQELTRRDARGEDVKSAVAALLEASAAALKGEIERAERFAEKARDLLDAR